MGLGLQHKTVDTLAKELDLPTTQLLGLFNRIIRKFIQYFNKITENFIETTIMKIEGNNETVQLNAINGESLYDELENAAKVCPLFYYNIIIYQIYNIISFDIDNNK